MKSAGFSGRQAADIRPAPCARVGLVTLADGDPLDSALVERDASIYSKVRGATRGRDPARVRPISGACEGIV
ncbi:Hypothetical protein SMAX5B_016204 [Scophthalmus maximus]|uniref:Uncharacterized protein n=1 Tax=Scophthalmus maximus TaxID=52904 RepID=A0A2U9BLA2_SCOMX|nr:Hypothetical protein SMAX5B_016204 [Scophthalmus maximus]KAF0047620.1 hypothetical protein F2P81_001253 [Scophthalmus maximus]